MDDIPNESPYETCEINLEDVLDGIVNDVSEEDEEFEETSEPDPNFRWLDPELPAGREFIARMTSVDDAGQIYLHLYENRSTMRSIRGLLHNKFATSEWSPLDRVDE